MLVDHAPQSRQPVNHMRVGHNPSRAQARSDGFRERRQIHHVSRILHALKRYGAMCVGRFPAVPQIAVSIVFHDQTLIAPRHVNEFAASFGRQRGTGGVLERRDGVDELGPESRAIAVQQVCTHTVLVHWNADDARIRRTEGLQCREERGLFDQHAVAGVDERAHDEVDALLGAGEHHHVADAALYASCAHMFGKQRTQLFESLDR